MLLFIYYVFRCDLLLTLKNIQRNFQSVQSTEVQYVKEKDYGRKRLKTNFWKIHAYFQDTHHKSSSNLAHHWHCCWLVCILELKYTIKKTYQGLKTHLCLEPLSSSSLSSSLSWWIVVFLGPFRGRCGPFRGWCGPLGFAGVLMEWWR